MPGPMLDHIVITPDPASLAADETLQFTATGYWDDASTRDITHYCVWGILGVSVNLGLLNILRPATQETLWTTLSTAGIGVAIGISPGTISSPYGWWCRFEVSEEPAYAAIFPPEPERLISAAIDVTVTTPVYPPAPEGRFSIAFDDPTLEPYPAWTRLDDHPNLVASYAIDRGRSYELDRTDTGRAVVQISDPGGLLDPTNPDGPYYGKLRPLLQAAIARYNPLSEEWQLRYRGFIEDFDYGIDPSQRLNRLSLSLVDLFEIISAAEMQPEQFGEPPEGELPPPETVGQVYFTEQTCFNRMFSILSDFGLHRHFQAIFFGDVDVQQVVYSPGESPLAALQEAADADLPAVANLYCERSGRLCFHNRRSKFDPLGVAAEVGAGFWDYHEWKVGDGAAIAASPSDTVQLRSLGFNRGLAKVINSANATPAGIADEDVAGQTVTDPGSIGLYGIRSWSASNLLTKASAIDFADSLTETRRFASYVVSNYAEPGDRITDISFRSLSPDDARAAALWEFLSKVDISDSVELHAAAAGGGGFDGERYFVEGIHEEVRPLDPDYDDVTLRLDLSPRAYFAVDPWPSS